jgi:hypothetical protein
MLWLLGLGIAPFALKERERSLREARPPLEMIVSWAEDTVLSVAIRDSAILSHGLSPSIENDASKVATVHRFWSRPDSIRRGRVAEQAFYEGRRQRITLVSWLSLIGPVGLFAVTWVWFGGRTKIAETNS